MAEGAVRTFVLTAPQMAMWVPQALFPGRPVANCGVTVAIAGALDLRLFSEAIRILVEETDALRLRVRREGDAVLQEVGDCAGYAIESVDFAGSADPDSAAAKWIDEYYWRPVEWTDFPLF